MYCLAMLKCGLGKHCVQASLCDAQPQAWHMLQSPYFIFLIGIVMPLGVPLINIIDLAFSYLYIWLALLIASILLCTYARKQ